jgi:hypothetical protein
MAALLALGGATGCDTTHEQQNQDELAELLHDEPLTNIRGASLSERASAQPASRVHAQADETPDMAFPPPDLSPGGGGSGGVAGGPGGAGGAGGAGGGPVGFDMGLPPPPPVFGPLGRWSFDDCTAARTNLNDSGGNNDVAFRSVSTACVTGLANLGVAFAQADSDLVYVPDQPFFDFSNGVTVSGWFKPDQVTKTRTLFRKRDDASSSSFALVLHNSKYEFVINLGNGHAASLAAPTKAKVGVWTHVAATYDNSTIRLYLDGKEVGHFDVPGQLVAAPGPFLMGNDGSKRLFAGTLDNASLDLRALSPDEVMQLTCLRRPVTLAGTPAISPPTQPGATATYDITLVNNDSASCGASDFAFFTNFTPNIDVQPSFTQISQLQPGATGHIAMTATPSDSIDPGTFTIFFQAFSQTNFNFITGSVQLEVAGPAGCHVTPSRELMITNTSIVDDPIRTVASSGSSDPRAGAWTLKRLLENMAPKPEDAPDMFEAVLKSFTVATTVNGFTIDLRPGFKSSVLDAWPRDAAGKLDLAKAPVLLQAIVNRFDLRDLSKGDAGEGRFVFAFTQNGQTFQPGATLIFEYKLPAKTDADVLDWANAWHNLGAQPFPSESYNAALQAITDRFSARGARPDHPNGNAINAVRTNEIVFGGAQNWQLREFGLSADTGLLVPRTIAQTPDLSFNNSAKLADFVTANQATVLADTFVVPEQLQGAPFATGAVFNDLSAWNVPGVSSDLRHHLSVNTCNGCHSSAETGTGFLHISPRFAAGGGEATLSGFLTGITIGDPFTGQPRQFNDLRRRRDDMSKLVCTSTPSLRALRKGIARVH